MGHWAPLEQDKLQQPRGFFSGSGVTGQWQLISRGVALDAMSPISTQSPWSSFKFLNQFRRSVSHVWFNFRFTLKSVFLNPDKTVPSSSFLSLHLTGMRVSRLSWQIWACDNGRSVPSCLLSAVWLTLGNEVNLSACWIGSVSHNPHSPHTAWVGGCILIPLN